MYQYSELPHSRGRGYKCTCKVDTCTRTYMYIMSTVLGHHYCHCSLTGGKVWVRRSQALVQEQHSLLQRRHERLHLGRAWQAASRQGWRRRRRWEEEEGRERRERSTGKAQKTGKITKADDEKTVTFSIMWTLLWCTIATFLNVKLCSTHCICIRTVKRSRIIIRVHILYQGGGHLACIGRGTHFRRMGGLCRAGHTSGWWPLACIGRGLTTRKTSPPNWSPASSKVGRVHQD